MTEFVAPTISILGIPVSIFDGYDDAVRLLRQRIMSRQQTFCAAINPEKVYRAQQDPLLRKALDSVHVRICDGVGISIASRLLYGKPIPRCTGIDLLLKLIELAAHESW